MFAEKEREREIYKRMKNTSPPPLDLCRLDLHFEPPRIIPKLYFATCIDRPLFLLFKQFCTILNTPEYLFYRLILSSFRVL